MIELPPTFAVHCVKDRWFALAPSDWSQAAGRTFERAELRAVDAGGALAPEKPAQRSNSELMAGSDLKF